MELRKLWQCDIMHTFDCQDYISCHKLSQKIILFSCSVPGCFSSLVRLCFSGTEKDVVLGSDQSPHPSSVLVRSFRQDAMLLMFCFIGLQGSYLTWGVLQEKVMTQVRYQTGTYSFSPYRSCYVVLQKERSWLSGQMQTTRVRHLLPCMTVNTIIINDDCVCFFGIRPLKRNSQFYRRGQLNASSRHKQSSVYTVVTETVSCKIENSDIHKLWEQ